MSLSRRDLLKTGALAGAAIITDNTFAETTQPTKSTQPIRIGVSTYSYWHFDRVKYPIEKVIENAARIGFDGVEILHRQMESEEKKYLNNLKRTAFANGIALFFLSIHQNFVWPDKAKRQEHIDHTKKCIDLAHYLGCPAIRLNSGRWNTIPSFQKMLDSGDRKRRCPAIPTTTRSNGASSQSTNASRTPKALA